MIKATVAAIALAFSVSTYAQCGSGQCGQPKQKQCQKREQCQESEKCQKGEKCQKSEKGEKKCNRERKCQRKRSGKSGPTVYRSFENVDK